MPQETAKISVPWTGFDVLLFFALWFAALIASSAVAGIVVHNFFSAPPQVQAGTEVEATENQGHPILQLAQQSKKSPIVFLIAFFAVVIAVPILEEFLFRMLLQGWLETKFTQFRLPYASGISIVIVSCLFATMHGGNQGAVNMHVLVCYLAIYAVLCLLIFALGIVFLLRIGNVKVTHLLFGKERFFRPRFFTNAGYCLLVLVFVYGLFGILTVIFRFSRRIAGVI